MAENAAPSRNPSNTDSMVGMFKEVLQKFLQGVDDMLPAVVIAFDRDSNRVQVQPLIRMLTTDGQTVARAQIASIPVFQIGGGNVVLNFNLEPGNFGWIKANDRDISLFMQSFSEAPPNTFRKHSFEDAVFFPDAMRGYTINPEDEGNCVLQTLDGTQRVAIWPDKIKITSDNEIVLDAPVTRITGALESGTGSGDVTIRGTLTVEGDVIAGLTEEISLIHHVHSDVVTGSDESGEPVPA